MQLNPSTCYMKGEAYSIAQAWQWRFPMMWCTTAAACSVAHTLTRLQHGPAQRPVAILDSPSITH